VTGSFRSLVFRRGRKAAKERGEALTLATLADADSELASSFSLVGGPRPSRWRVLWTRSHCEQLVRDQLASRGYSVFVPTVEVWSRHRGLKHLVRVPLFPGYLFLNHALDKASYLDVLRARGLVRVLGERWDRLAVVPDREIEAIRRVVEARLPAQPHPYLGQGQRVRIVSGPLASVEGILLRFQSTKGLIVLSVELLKRSVAVEVDCTAVVPA
jgi:transcriptional antiterminator NusG